LKTAGILNLLEWDGCDRLLTHLHKLRFPQTMQSNNREILQLGNPSLRQLARSVENLQDPALQRLIDELIETLTVSGGVGIAAPQVGLPLRLMIVASHPTPRYPDAPEMPPLPLLNPQIVSQSSALEKGWEGCLSVPGIRGLVPRALSVTVDYIDRDGKPQQQTFHDFVARIFQHEYDHLQGIVFVDRVESTHELMTEQEYQRQIMGSVS
jgi:peptide deformylase